MMSKTSEFTNGVMSHAPGIPAPNAPMHQRIVMMSFANALRRWRAKSSSIAKGARFWNCIHAICSASETGSNIPLRLNGGGWASARPVQRRYACTAGGE